MIKRNPTVHQLKKMGVEELKVEFEESYQEWVITVGGEKNAFLKEFTSQFRMA
jgi:hypothetical protein